MKYRRSQYLKNIFLRELCDKKNKMKSSKVINGAVLALFLVSCSNSEMKTETPESDSKVRIMTLDPGHFHAGLIHKSMYPVVDSTIYIFAPEGPELKDHLNRIASYNNREESPTAWNLEVYSGPDYLKKMISQKPGNVMMVAGKNDLKIDYILAAVENGIHVYADKPLVINPEGFQKLKKAFQIAAEKELLLYDIMTERFEITTLLQRELSMISDVFGELENGTPENPAITKESIHHFFKYVSGVPLIRPDWFFATVFQQASGQPDQSLFAGQDQAGVGVQVLGVVEDQSELQARYEPNHPAADEAGYVYYPNVNVVEEMADMISASRAFQTNAELMNTAKTMLQKVLTLGQ